MQRPDRQPPRWWGAALTIAVMTAIAVPAIATETTVPVVDLDGAGHGHGVGMSQWGAHALAADGASFDDILATFYPGTALSSDGGEIAVVVDHGDPVVITSTQGGWLHSTRGGTEQPGFPIRVEAGTPAEVSHDGTGLVVSVGPVRPQGGGSQPFAAQQDDDCLVLCDDDPPPDDEPGPDPEPEPGPSPCVLCTTTTTAPPDGGPPPERADPEREGGTEPGDDESGGSDAGPESRVTEVWLVADEPGAVAVPATGRTYRGMLRVAGDDGALTVYDHVDVEDYLVGMAEVPHTWPAAVLQAQAVAARTYALRAVARSGSICDSERCQVYVGIEGESSPQRAAVEATRGMVLTYRGALATTLYSASAGGHSATLREGFGAGYELDYLVARPVPADDVKPWTRRIALDVVADRLGYPGTITQVVIAETGPSGRPVAMSLLGSAGPVEIDPQEFRRQLALPSTLFAASVSSASSVPPPPPPPDPEPGWAEQAAVLAQVRPPSPVRTAAPAQITTTAMSSGGSTAGWTPLGILLAVASTLTGAATLVRWRIHRP